MPFGSYTGANRWSRAALTEPENGSGPGRFAFAGGRDANSASRILEGLTLRRGLVERGKGIGWRRLWKIITFPAVVRIQLFSSSLFLSRYSRANLIDRA